MRILQYSNPFATLELKINNICCDDMQLRFQRKEIGYSVNNDSFVLDDNLINVCPYCKRRLTLAFKANHKINAEY